MRTRPRWRCAFCDASGLAATQDQALDDLERHYQLKHMTKERT